MTKRRRCVDSEAPAAASSSAWWNREECVAHALCHLSGPALRTFGCVSRQSRRYCDVGRDLGTAAVPKPRTGLTWRHWQSTLRLGDRVDAKDVEGRWFEALVVESTEVNIKVHYCSWDKKYDQRFDRESPSIAPLFTHFTDWRPLLRKGQIIEARRNDGCWYMAIVRGLSRDKDASRRAWTTLEAVGMTSTRQRGAFQITTPSYLQARHSQDMHRWKIGEYGSEEIAPLGMHIRPLTSEHSGSAHATNSVILPMSLLIELMSS